MSVADQILSDPGHIKEISKLKRELDKSKQQNKILQGHIDARDIEIAEYQARQEYLDELGTDPSSRHMEYKPPKVNTNATAVIVWNDWHVEERVDPDTVNGLNTYSPEIAAKRLKKCFSKSIMLLESARQICKINHLVLAILGDVITGYIHEELQEGNYLSPTEASLFAEEQIMSGINFLLKEAGVKQITIPTAIGNHGRTTKKPRVATAYKNSYEWLLYNHIAKWYRKEPRVRFKIEKSYHNYLDIQGKSIRFHHGDYIRYNGGVGGITIPANKAIAEWDKTKKADLDVFGHWHQFMFGHKFVCCNCSIGYTPFAVRIKAPSSPPSQTFIVIDKHRPSPVDVREIYCD